MAFEKLFRLFYERLCNYALGILKEDAQAEEVVQEVFVGIWQKRDEIAITTSIKSYLYRAVHNRCLNLIRHGKVRLEYVNHSLHSDSGIEPPSSGVEQKELQNRIHDAIEALPTECARVFRLSRFEELSYHEISEFLGISIKTVENQMGKALKLLRSRLAEYLVQYILPFATISVALIGVNQYLCVITQTL